MKNTIFTGMATALVTPMAADGSVSYRLMGDGDLPMEDLMRALKSVNYDGFLCAELDRSRFGNKISAEMSLKFLKENW